MEVEPQPPRSQQIFESFLFQPHVLKFERGMTFPHPPLSSKMGEWSDISLGNMHCTTLLKKASQPSDTKNQSNLNWDWLSKPPL